MEYIMKKEIYFDLDGTIYDLYGMENWLERIENEKPNTFTDGKFIVNYDEFMQCVKELKEQGYNFNVISWLPYDVTYDYRKKCEQEKRSWIKKFLPFVKNVEIQFYGILKHTHVESGILIDDNEKICRHWRNENRIALNVNKEFNVISALKKLIRGEVENV